MSNTEETPKGVSVPRAEDVDELAMFKWQCQIKDEDEEKTAESIVMSGMIPHVLEKILSFLPVSSLKECRLVNTDWNKAAVVQLRKDLPHLNFSNCLLNVSSFLDLMLDNKISPFAKFWINLDWISSHHMETLLNTIAPSATHLDIWNNINETRFDSVDRIPEFPMLANLQQNVGVNAVKSFHLNQFMSENGENDCMSGSTVFGILQKSPKLQNLKVYFRYYGGQPSSYFKNFFFDSLEKKNNANLNHLHLDIPGLTDIDLSRLIPLGLRLNSLCLKLNFTLLDVGLRNQCSFIDFLSCQCETLVHLELQGLFDNIFDRIQFPLLKKLKTLTIRDCDPFGNDFKLSPSINYNERLPSLTKLEIQSNNAWIQLLPDTTYPPVQAMEHLQLCLSYPHGVDKLTEIDVLHAAQYFPNLKVLGEIPANVRIANAIYKWMPQLEELTFGVGFTPSIDDVITGLSLEECAELRLLPISEIRKLSVDNNEPDLGEDSLRPLSSLKNLKILRLIQKGSLWNPVEFSRVSTLLVLTKMPSLQTIDFGERSMGYIEKINDDDAVQNLKDSGKSVLYVEETW